MARLSFVLLATLLAARVGAEPVFESDPVRPVALSPDGTRLFVANPADARLEILEVVVDGVRPLGSVPVGLEPVAVAVASAGEVWVVNHLSDSVSVVDVAADPPRVVRTLLVGDEPRDIVFAGPDGRRAFIAAAHRGQNTPFAPEAGTPSLGRADVWVFDRADLGEALGGEPLAIVTLFGDKPRALAATPDGGTVYAAIFHSGNRTTTIPAEAVCDGGSTAPPCLVDGLPMPGGLPAPNRNFAGVLGPKTGLIARYDAATGAWLDELGRDWRNAARFSLPDLDVFAIDALADPPVEVAAVSGVGTILYGLAVNPGNGALYVANTEAVNTTRLEDRLQARLHEARITVVEEGVALPRHLNKHIDYAVVPSPPGVAERSLATPLAVAVSGDGETLYVAAFGSSKVGAFSTSEIEDDSFVPDAAEHLVVSGGGPSGLVLDEGRGRLYVATRFDVGLSVVDLATRSEVQHLRFHDPEPAAVTAGRRLLYDAVATSSNGEASCAACHVFGDFDGLAWDLGRSDLPVEENPLPLLQTSGRDDEDFHPLKGPMTTQTLRGMATHGSMHWRGDRTSGNDPGGDPHDERAAFAEFNPAFVSLMGRASPLTVAEMEGLTDFALALAQPPNPFARLDGSLTPAQAAGRDAFFSEDCSECHTLDPAQGFFGTSGAAAVNANVAQFMKVPQLRNLYQKIGRVFGILFDPLFDAEHLGDQVRGFGFQHDGSAGRIDDPAGDFLFVFPSELAPVVGQQVTLDQTNAATVTARLDLLEARADAGDCELTVRGVGGGEARGWLRVASGLFVSDRSAEVALAGSHLRDRAAVPGQSLTFTCVPPGSGERLALDRDGDGARDRDEVDAGSDPADAASTPTAAPAPGAFVVYRAAESSDEFFALGPVAAAGAFGDLAIDVVEPVGLAMPASDAVAPPAGAALGWSVHRVRPARGSSPEASADDLHLMHACGDAPIRVGGRAELLVPARISELDPVTRPVEAEHRLDPLLCRSVRRTRGREVPARLFPPGTQLQLGDAFQVRRYELRAPSRVCRPTSLEGSPSWRRGPRAGEGVPLVSAAVRSPARAYACYRAALAKRAIEQDGCGPASIGDRGSRIRPAQEPHVMRSGVAVADSFASVEMTTRSEVEVCLAVEVSIPAP